MRHGRDRRTSLRLLWFSLIALSLFGLTTVDFGRTLSETATFVVSTKHYGINASEIERSITDPLENLMSELPGIKKMRSTSEFSQSRLFITLDGTVPQDQFYLDLRDRVDRAYAGWPDSVQRPQIHSSAGNDDPVFIAAFSATTGSLPALRSILEKDVKKRIERLRGVGEVTIGGGGLKEIHVELQADRAARIGLFPDNVGGLLQGQHLRAPLGNLTEGNRELGLVLDGYLDDLEDVGDLFLESGSSGPVPLNSVAEISYQYREPEEVARLDGRRTVTLYVKPTGDANIVQVGRRLRTEIETLRGEGYDIEIAYDLGALMEESIRGVLFSLLIGMAGIVLFMLFSFPSFRIIFHLAFSLPLVGCLVLGLLAFFDIAVDQALLAGMAIGVGMMIDAALVITDHLYSGTYEFSRSAPPLVASTLTTLIVFLPLAKASSSLPGIASLSLAIVLVLSISLAYYLLFLPPFLRNGIGLRTSLLAGIISKAPLRIIDSCAERPRIILIASLAISLSGLFAALTLPRYFGAAEEKGTLFARLEMESGATLESVDRRTNLITEALRGTSPGILSIESQSDPGQSRLTFRYKPRIIDAKSLANQIKAIASTIPGVFAYIPTGESVGGTTIEFTLTGGDNKVLRELAETLVGSASDLPWVTGGLLHFKENPPSYVFVPDMEILGSKGLDVADMAGILKWSIQGPVALKWFQNGEERDLRVFSTAKKAESIEELRNLSLSTDSGDRIMLNQLGTWTIDEEPSRITHANRQRAVDFSLTTDQTDLDVLIDSASQFIRDSSLPSGYGLFYSRDLEEKKGEYRNLWIRLIIAIALIYAVLAVQSESFTDPLLILAIVPVGIALPLIAYRILGRSLRTSTLIGLIILCGMAVNNAILILSSFKESPKKSIAVVGRVVSERYRSLFLTSGTTLLGTLPLILRPNKGTSFTFDMALILSIGLLGSFLASLTFYPALLSWAFRLKKTPQRG